MIESEEDDTSFNGSLYYENSEKAEPEEMDLEQTHKRPLYEDEEEVRPKRLTVTEAGRFTVTAARKSSNTTFFPEEEGLEKRPKKTSNISSRENSNDSDHYEVIQVKAELHTDEM